MKRIIFLFSFIAISATTFSQLKPEKGDFGIGFEITGIANVGFFNATETILGNQEINDPFGIINGFTLSQFLPQQMVFGKYYLHPDLALRVGIGGGFISDKVEFNDSSDVIINKLTATSVGLNVGVEKHFASAAIKIDPYGGVQLNSAYLSSIKSTREVTTTTGGTMRTITYPGGYGVGVHFFLGFNYFFTSNFALGAELSLGVNRISMGGEWSSELINSADGTTIESQVGTFKNTHYMVQPNSTGGVNATIFF